MVWESWNFYITQTNCKYKEMILIFNDVDFDTCTP